MREKQLIIQAFSEQAGSDRQDGTDQTGQVEAVRLLDLTALLCFDILEVASGICYNRDMETNNATTQRETLNQIEKVLFSFDKTLKEQVRVSETIYLDKPYIDFRIFARKADGEYIPTKKGITISKDLAKFLKEAFNKIN